MMLSICCSIVRVVRYKLLCEREIISFFAKPILFQNGAQIKHSGNMLMRRTSNKEADLSQLSSATTRQMRISIIIIIGSSNSNSSDIYFDLFLLSALYLELQIE